MIRRDLTRRGTWLALTAALLAGGSGALFAPRSATAANGCAKPTGVYTADAPWAQRLLDPSRIWQLTDGAGVTVAVLGTGIDAANPQFGPRQIRDGGSVTGKGAPTGPANVDCDGRGTVAAGIVAARPSGATTFTGMAPGASLVAIKYSQSTTQGSPPANPDLLAAAIDKAIAIKATKVICVVVPADKDSAKLRAAVARAAAADIVVVSPAASNSSIGGSTKLYPSANAAVLSVGAINSDGTALSADPANGVDIAAPGAGLVSLAAGTNRKPGHNWVINDPSFAAAYVAGTVALVRAYRPELTARQVIERLTRTANRAASSARDPYLGWGVVNPYAAVTGQGVDRPPTTPSPAAGYEPPAADEPAGPNGLAVGLAVGGLASSVLLLIGVRVTRRGRAQGWHATSRSTAK